MIEDAEEQIQEKKRKKSDDVEEEEEKKTVPTETPVVVNPLPETPVVDEKVAVVEPVIEEVKPKEVPIQQSEPDSVDSKFASFGEIEVGKVIEAKDFQDKWNSCIVREKKRASVP